MKETALDIGKGWGLTGGVVAAAWLSNINMFITTLILLATLAWTIVRAMGAWYDLKEKARKK